MVFESASENVFLLSSMRCAGNKFTWTWYPSCGQSILAVAKVLSLLSCFKHVSNLLSLSLFERPTTERERKRLIVYLTDHSASTCQSQRWARMRSGTRSTIRVPIAENILAVICLPWCVLAGSWRGCRGETWSQALQCGMDTSLVSCNIALVCSCVVLYACLLFAS